ncbi:MAG: hypothetical protein AUK32_06985 [Candidatus Aquicultor secundus]|uniref:Ada DNA repair metal-binding domain-containing protein n=1 Tax=Candidatus Aquicultor secundus TaxID=1973895 RepID=A0A2M7T8Q4_9ACTN|nr:Ada metal-binding domain-containing protein [Candidatus Aquicultor secundus]OIO85543.1 MAG: hypothetical protein AUK32_06985 [Candidatus Aquicultor secundus]PIU27287.1 MAG: hypothetical protein COT10_04290 [Candidatus Aquicultor secundus]PIX52866.1 MAG: hypothetical protein COZ51_01825 [Candidatus Aquicultor secundus]PIY37943.1 MAG: hypothetical protein COZ03_09125 [Candidatus Aquicultor secundus]PIZ40210.1 MAG: hypothetical protein COY37_04340 [Candidatus Aquicultor secundus]
MDNDKQLVPKGDLQQRVWYKTWWGIIIAILLWPIMGAWQVWKKITWPKAATIIATAAIVFVALIALASCSLDRQQPDLSQGSISTEKPFKQTNMSPTTNALSTATTAPQTPNTTAAPAGEFAGSVKSNVYHYPSCSYVDRINPENLIWFSSAEDAQAKGYRACKVCQPPGYAPPTAVAPQDNQQSSGSDVIVHITRTGEKYHSAGCQYLSRSDIPISLSDAKAQGYTPCSRCNPPE